MGGKSFDSIDDDCIMACPRLIGKSVFTIYKLYYVKIMLLHVLQLGHQNQSTRKKMIHIFYLHCVTMEELMQVKKLQF